MKLNYPKSRVKKISGKTTVLPLAAAGLAGALLAISINRKLKTAATNQPRLLEEIEQTTDSISFSWPHTGGFYKVYRGEKLIYKGIETKVKDSQLSPGKLYSYSIEKWDNQGQIVSCMKVQTSTRMTSEEKENILQDMIITTTVADGRISLGWEPIEGISEYSVLRNGQKITTVQSTSFYDRNLSDDQVYTYTIKAKRPLQRSKQIKWEARSLIASAVGVIKKDSSTDIAAKEEFSITKKVGPIQELLRPIDENSKDIHDRTWKLRYTTFLEEKWLENPNAVSEDHYFKGDDREFDPNSTHFRTRADVLISCNSEESTAELEKEVGMTQAYNKEKEFIAEEMASDKKVKLEKILVYDDHLLFQLSHSVSNPMVVSPAIDYVVSGGFYRNGEFELTGVHDQAPNHEIYLQEGNVEKWQTIHLAESKGLEMMAKPMANHYWSYSTFTK